MKSTRTPMQLTQESRHKDLIRTQVVVTMITPESGTPN